MAIAIDGSVWVVTEPDLDAEIPEPGAPRREPYVITPETVTAIDQALHLPGGDASRRSTGRDSRHLHHLRTVSEHSGVARLDEIG